MIALENFFMGFMVAIQPQNLLYCFIGVATGTIVGVLPGIGPTAALALLLPTTFNLNPVSAIIMLSGLAYGGMYGGSITSILVNVPGEASTVITCLDGYQMAKKGRAGPALGIAALGSFIAGTLAVAGVMFLAPMLAKGALSFGSPEYFSLMMMSLLIVTYLVRGSMIKALIMVGVGLIFGTVGMDLLSGRERFVYGVLVLEDGISVVSIAIGLFGVAEVLETIGSSIKVEVYNKKLKGYWPSKQDWKLSALPMTRGTILGFILGILPGLSPLIPTFLSYGIEKKLSKNPAKFGTGAIEGVAAPEACNNSAATAGFVPLLGLGIPSNAFNAVLLGALMIHGLQPGPILMNQHPDLFWGVLSSMYLGNVMLVILNLPLIPLWVMILRIPYTLLSTIILIFCFLGSYSINNNIDNVFITFIFGVLGYTFKKYGFERPPLILAFILGPFIETAFRQSMILSDGNFSIFFLRPISLILMIIALGILVTAFIKPRSFSTKIEEED